MIDREDMAAGNDVGSASRPESGAGHRASSNEGTTRDVPLAYRADPEKHAADDNSDSRGATTPDNDSIAVASKMERDQLPQRTGYETEDDDDHLEDDLPGIGPADESTGTRAVIDRVLSRTSARALEPGPPPDGGARAWIVLLCTHITVMNSWGFINSFGVFQSYYVEALHRPPSDVAWIGSFQTFLLFFIGTFTGRMTDAGYFRANFTLGTVLSIGGCIAASFCTQYWQLFLAQGVCMGLGNGCLFCPAMAILSTYFHKRRAFAMGITAAGSVTGGLVYPSMVRQLLPKIGFGWTMRSLALIQIVTMVGANLGIRPRLPPRKGGGLVDWASFRDRAYTFYALGAFCSFLGIFIAFFYLSSYARDIVGLDYSASLNLILVLNGVSGPSRIIPAYLADKVGTVNMITVFAFLSGITSLSWMAVNTPGALYAWTVFYGIAAGGIQGLFPAGVASLHTDLSKAGVRLGMVFTIVSFACLAGPPIAGAIISAGGGNYHGAQGYGGAVMLLGGIWWMVARHFRIRRDGLRFLSRV